MRRSSNFPASKNSPVTVEREYIVSRLLLPLVFQALLLYHSVSLWGSLTHFQQHLESLFVPVILTIIYSVMPGPHFT